MSGGFFDYMQHNISEVADRIQYEIDNIRQETEDFMAREHNGLLSMIYKTEIIGGD